MGQNGPKRAKMPQNAQTEPKWPQMAQNGPEGPPKAQHRPKLGLLGPSSPTCATSTLGPGPTPPQVGSPYPYIPSVWAERARIRASLDPPRFKRPSPPRRKPNALLADPQNFILAVARQHARGDPRDPWSGRYSGYTLPIYASDPGRAALYICQLGHEL